MKYVLLLFTVCVGTAVVSSAQSAGMSAANTRPQMITMQEYPQHASQTGLAQEQDLREHGGSTSAHGERPLWEVMPEPHLTPLGDIARELRLAHATDRKAVIIWVN